jgi:hypothetical protein
MDAAPLHLHHRLLAVIDDPKDLSAASAALAGAGVGGDDIELLVGDEGIARLDRTGRRAGRWRRMARWLSYLTADQSVDLATYEAALADGRGVVVARIPDPELRRRAVAALRSVQPHFVNYFGPIATQDIIPWRGPQLDLPYYFHR